MKFVPTKLAGAYLIELKPFSDERGIFTRIFCRNDLAHIGFRGPIAQINHSLTRKRGTVRGMHYQSLPACEVKIIRCIRGRVFDVCVDLRRESDTFLQWHAHELSSEGSHMAYIPEGMAHGFQTLSDDTELIYFHSHPYTPESERGLRFDDPTLDIQWPLRAAMVSTKDQSYAWISDEFSGLSL